MTTKTLDEREAYAAMVRFLTAYMDRTAPDYPLAPLVADVAIETDWGPGDPASWSDWLSAVAAVKDGPDSTKGVTEL